MLGKFRPINLVFLLVFIASCFFAFSGSALAQDETVERKKVDNTPKIPSVELPDEPPPVAPDFIAPARPLPSAERVGVDVANQMPLTLEEVVELALQNNNDIETSKVDVRIAEFNLRSARGIYDPRLESESYYERATTPVASTIGGAANGSLTATPLFRLGFGQRVFAVRGRFIFG